jgi:hypothetical protein
VPTQELLRRAQRDKDYAGKKSAFYVIVAALRPKIAPPVVVFDGVPGEFSQQDFGEVDVRYADGCVERIHFFASRLKYSRFAQVSIVDNERVETLIGLCRHFQAFGGVPLLAALVGGRPSCSRPEVVATCAGSTRRSRRRSSRWAAASRCAQRVAATRRAPSRRS